MLYDNNGDEIWRVVADEGQEIRESVVEPMSANYRKWNDTSKRKKFSCNVVEVEED